MAHFLTIVLVPPDTSAIVAEVKRLMEPHIESEVPAYKVRTDVSDWSERQLADTLASGDLGNDDDGYFWWQTNNPDGRWDYWKIGGGYNGVLIGQHTPLPHKDGPLELNTRPVTSLLAQEAPTWQDLGASALVTPDGTWTDTFDFHDFDGPGSNKDRWTETWSKWHAHTLPILKQYEHHVAVALDVHS
ncbi:MAG: hypothetical protein AAGF99_01385 [Bacteroidota bacterium]